MIIADDEIRSQMKWALADDYQLVQAEGRQQALALSLVAAVEPHPRRDP